MGLFSQIEDNINNMGGGLFLDIAKLAGKGIKAGNQGWRQTGWGRDKSRNQCGEKRR